VTKYLPLKHELKLHFL